MVFTNTTKNLFLVTVVLIFIITPYVAKASDDSNNGNLTTTAQINVKPTCKHTECAQSKR